MNINSVASIFNSAKKTAESEVKQVIAEVENLAKAESIHVGQMAVQDVSRIVHEFHVTALTVGKDITVKFDHAAGEVKRTVVNGAITVEDLVAHLRSLGA